MSKYTIRKDGRYYGKVFIGYDDDGKAIRKNVYASSESELERKMSEQRTDVMRGMYSDDKNVSLRNYGKKWLSIYKTDIEPVTFKKYENIVLKHLDIIGDMKLSDIRKSDVQMQQNACSDHPEVQRMLVITIKQILECAIDDGLLYRNVARKVHSPAAKSGSSRRALSDAEKNAIKNCIFTLPEKLYIDLLYSAGLRPEEALALMHSDFDASNSALTVARALTYHGGKRIKSTKTPAGRRTIPIPQALTNEIANHHNNSLFIFSDKSGEVISQSAYKKMWRSIFNKINAAMGGSDSIKATDLCPYCFRHNYATMLYYSGIDVKRAQYLMGHSSVKITLEIYTHLNSKDNDIGEKINSFVI